MAYSALSPNDASGITLMMTAVAPTAHLEHLDRFGAWNPQDLNEVVDSADWIASVRAINSALKVSRERFAQSLESMAASPDPTILQTLWSDEEAVKAAISLLLSPADTIHEAMISLIQPSFENVDDRGDCFRVLLERFPNPAMDGLCSFLSTFIRTANRVPEACSMAKWLVRCFTDVLEVLCQPSGSSAPLLQSAKFLASYADGKWMTRRVSDLWQLMTDSLALIFKRTSNWANYYDNDVMVDWMRDALIFGRGITDNIRIFESAILSRIKTVQEDSLAPVKMTQVGKGLVEKIQVVLHDLVGWLRLTE
jgi:senataxin